MPKLTDKQIRAIKENGRYGDGAGLWFVVRGGSRTWHLRWMKAGKPREMSLGSFPDLPLAEARKRAQDARRVIKEGGDPIALKADHKASTARTFRVAAVEYIDAHKAGWRNAKHGQQWGNTLALYVYPVIGDLPLPVIGTDHVLKILKPIWESKPETASRVRGRIEAVLDYAKAREWRQGENPARWRGHLDHLLPARAKVQRVEHHPAVPYAKLGTVMARLAESEGIAARCLRFLTLTAARSGEARGARWQEIDLEAGVWIVPGERMKGALPHRVPLSPEAMEILHSMQPFARGPESLVFPGQRMGSPLSDVALAKALRIAAGEGFTTHGMRSAFRDWTAERTSFPRAAAERCLAHVNKDKTEAAYLRADMLDVRRQIMDTWARFLLLEQDTSGVIPLRRPAS